MKYQITFKQFLEEGGKETADYGVQRATAKDIKAAISILNSVLGDSKADLENQLLGSVGQTLRGTKKDSGDIDVAYPIEKMDEAHAKMMKHTNNEGHLNRGTKVGSYALDVGGKKVQLDLMFVKDINWAKFGYHSSEGEGSKYPGAVRRILMTNALAYTQEPGKDFIYRDKDGSVIARASRSIKQGDGMERMFKMRKKNKKTGEYLKSIETVSPEELEKEFGDKFKFSKEVDLTTNPDDAAKLIFGPKYSAKDILTAENLIKLIKKLPNAVEILKAAKDELEKSKLPIPEEL